ncbi:hypothetical protein KQR57_03460 [Bacillus inaquosorum]|nr:hypothetical protein [Bacillus inaquosorum]
MRSHSVVCIGELLIDFFCTDVDVDLMEGRNFLKVPAVLRRMCQRPLPSWAETPLSAEK